jgi:hypothetical protein
LIIEAVFYNMIDRKTGSIALLDCELLHTSALIAGLRILGVEEGLPPRGANSLCG